MGVKKSTVVTIATSSVTRYTAASSAVSWPTRRSGSELRGREASSGWRSAGASLQAHPAPCDSEVSGTLVPGVATCLLSAPVPARQFTDAELEAAIEALSDRERFREAEANITRIVPQLTRILNEALADADWFEAHEAEVLKAATNPDDDERLRAVRTLLAEETRTGMLVGVAVGWALARELEGSTNR